MSVLQTPMSDVAGYVLFVAIALLGLVTTVVGAVRAWTWLNGRGLPVAVSIALTMLFALLAFLGFWLVLDLYWVVRAATRAWRRGMVRRTGPAT
jgi:heme/copper-type cytochrome/quinol oxidase subunit 3